MNRTIEQISHETLGIIESQAKIAGLSIDEYLRTLIPNQRRKTDSERVLMESERPLYETGTPQELAEALTEWAESHTASTPPIPLESLRRENLY